MTIIDNYKPFIAGIILGTLFGFMLFRVWQHSELKRMYEGKNNARKID